MVDEIHFKHVIPAQIRFSDVDQFGHMNNSVYFSLYDLAKTAYLRDVLGPQDWSKFGMVVANLNADFLAPVFFSDNLVIETSILHLGTKSFTLLQRAVSEETREVKCQCRTVMVAFDVTNQTPMAIPQACKDAISKYEGRSLEDMAKRVVTPVV